MNEVEKLGLEYMSWFYRHFETFDYWYVIKIYNEKGYTRFKLDVKDLGETNTWKILDGRFCGLLMEELGEPYKAQIVTEYFDLMYLGRKCGTEMKRFLVVDWTGY